MQGVHFQFNILNFYINCIFLHLFRTIAAVHYHYTHSSGNIAIPLIAKRKKVYMDMFLICSTYEERTTTLSVRLLSYLEKNTIQTECM